MNTRQKENNSAYRSFSSWLHRLSMVFHLPSIHFPHSFPHDIMHILFENICPTLVDIWTGHGKFKNLTTIDTGYHIAPHIWAQISLETTAAYKNWSHQILSVRCLISWHPSTRPNIGCFGANTSGQYSYKIVSQMPNIIGIFWTL